GGLLEGSPERSETIMADKWAKYAESAEDKWAKYAVDESPANRALTGTGLSVSPPKQPNLPAELGGPAPAATPTPWYLGGRAADAVDEALHQGSDQMWNGAATM